MGPAAAFNALADAQVSQVTLCDVSEEQLQTAQRKLSGMTGGAKLTTTRLDLNDQAAAWGPWPFRCHRRRAASSIPLGIERCCRRTAQVDEVARRRRSDDRDNTSKQPARW
jgi:hypothetical protein